MSPFLRRSLFFLFLGGFLLAAPAVVFYTAGYRFSPGAGRFVQTGLLSAESAPPGAQIWMDGTLQSGLTPSLQKNALPGLHAVELKKDGYLPWKKTLSFTSRQTAFVSALLFADLPASRLWTADPAQTTTDGPHGRVATTRIQGAWTELWVLETETGVERLIARLPAQSAPLWSFRWSPDGSALAATVGSQTILVDVKDGARADVPAGTPLEWDAGQGARYLVTTHAGLFAVGPHQPAQRVSSAADAAISTPNGIVIVAGTGDRLSLARLRPPNPPEILASLPAGSYLFQPAPSGLLLLQDRGRHRLILAALEGNRPLLLSADAKQWSWEPGGKRLLYTDGYDLHLFDSAVGTDETITRLSDPITGLAWHPSGIGALFSQDHRVAVLEFADQGGRMYTTLVEGDGLRDVWTDARGRSLYFLGTVGKETGVFERPLVR